MTLVIGGILFGYVAASVVVALLAARFFRHGNQVASQALASREAEPVAPQLDYEERRAA